MVTRVRAGTAIMEGQISSDDRHLDVLRRLAAFRGIFRVADRLETAGEAAS